MATPIPTGYTIDYVTTIQQAVADAVNNLLDPVNHYFYYMSDINWNKIDLVSKTVLASNVAPTNSPGGGDDISIAPDGYIWFIQPDFGPSFHRVACKIDPTTFATVSTFDMATNWGFVNKTFGGHTVIPGTQTQWPTQDGKIVAMCTWANGTPANSKPAPIFGAFNATTLADLGTYQVALPPGTPGTYFLYQPPTNNYYVETRTAVNPLPILDEAGSAYILGRTTRQGTVVPIVYDWYVWKIDLATMTSTPWHFTGDVTVGQGTAMIYDAASNSLLVQSTTGKLFVVDCSTGLITNTVSGLFANGNLATFQTQGKTLNGVFFTCDSSGGVVKDFITVPSFGSEGTFVNTSGVNWGGVGAGYTWVYDPILNCIVVPTGNNYPPGIGTHPATLIYELAAVTSLTTLTGKFFDSLDVPISNGKMTLKLNVDAVSPTGQIVANLITTILLDSNGAMIPTGVWSNAVLNAGPYDNVYTATVYSSKGQQVWRSLVSVPNVTTYDISQAVPVPTM